MSYFDFLRLSTEGKISIEVNVDGSWFHSSKHRLTFAAGIAGHAVGCRNDKPVNI